jgi:hypothetical protein
MRVELSMNHAEVYIYLSCAQYRLIVSQAFPQGAYTETAPIDILDVSAISVSGPPPVRPLPSSQDSTAEQSEIAQMLDALDITTPRRGSALKKLFLSHRVYTTQALRGVLGVVSDNVDMVPLAKAVFGGAITAIQTLEVSV